MQPGFLWVPAHLVLALAWAVAAGATGETLSQCRGVSGDAARLACYDALADRHAAQPAQAANGAPAATPDPGASRLSAEESFGLATGPGPVTEIMAKVTAVQLSRYGKLILSLDNGQIWSQTDSPAPRIKPGHAVRIRRGALGSYLLTSETGKGAIRVHRNQ